MAPLVLPAIVALSAGVMNLLPWGGPTARAMSVLRAGVDQVFVPVLPAMGVGIAWVFFVAWWLGRSERLRLARGTGVARQSPAHGTGDASAARTALFHVNAALDGRRDRAAPPGAVAGAVAVPEVPPPLIFMTAFAIALPLNRRTAAAQRDQMVSHAASAVLVVSDDPRRGCLHRHPEWQRHQQGDLMHCPSREVLVANRWQRRGCP